MVAILIYGVVVLFLALCSAGSLCSLRLMRDAGLFRHRGGFDRRPASPSTSPAGTSTTELAARIAAYSSSSTERGLESAVLAIPRTLDALSRRIAPGFSTAATGARGANGQRGPIAASPDPLSWPS